MPGAIRPIIPRRPKYRPESTKRSPDLRSYPERCGGLRAAWRCSARDTVRPANPVTPARDGSFPICAKPAGGRNIVQRDGRPSPGRTGCTGREGRRAGVHYQGIADEWGNRGGGRAVTTNCIRPCAEIRNVYLNVGPLSAAAHHLHYKRSFTPFSAGRVSVKRLPGRYRGSSSCGSRQWTSSGGD